MAALLLRIFCRGGKDPRDASVRTACGTAAGIIGMFLNLLLFTGKMTAGVLCASVSVMADAWNNLSDAGSSVISLVSFRIAAKPADREHPFGHARIEYVASLIVSFFIMLIGYELFTDSLMGILHPEEKTAFSTLSFVVLAVGIAVKLFMGLFNRTLGRKIDSEMLAAAATDSFSDTLSTGAVLVSAIISRVTGFDLDCYMGMVIAVVIFVSGVKILNENKNKLLGEAPDPALEDKIREMVKKCPEALGMHDLLIHSYGVGMTVISLHVEVDGAGDIFALHDAIDRLEKQIGEQLHAVCTIHMDPIVTDDAQVNALREQVARAVCEIDPRLKIHDFRFVDGTTHKNLIFDVAAPFELTLTNEALKSLVTEKLRAIDPAYHVVLTVDRE